MLTFGPITVERWKPEEANANVYLLKDRLLVHGCCRTTIGGLACEPYLSVRVDVADDEVGRVLLRVLNEARVTLVPDLPIDQKKMLQAAGVRSWKKITEGLSCHVTQIGSEISILPTRREGRAFIHVPELTVRVLLENGLESIGRALRDGLGKSA
jgi:hypothetical protein